MLTLVDGGQVADLVTDDTVPCHGIVIGIAGTTDPPAIQCRIGEVSIELNGTLNIFASLLAVAAIPWKILTVPLRTLQAAA